MGFLNKILKGLGFEDEESDEPIVNKKIKKEKKKKSGNISASFDLEKSTTEDEIHNIETKQTENITEIEETNIEVIKATSQQDVQACVLKLKDKKKILLNLEHTSDSDLVRSLDFVSGAVYALGLKMQKIDEKNYIIQ